MSRNLLSLALLAALLAAPAPAAARAQANCGNSAATEATATRLARECGRSVEVESARTEQSLVFAEPSGLLRYETSAVPQRARRADGTWTAIDLTLRAAADRTLRPVAAAADVRFSPGGSGAAMTVVNGGRSLSLSWPAALPTPIVGGDTAVYREVLAGVDLVLRATRTGFTHVVVVKTAAAAANPAVRRLRFGVGGDSRLRQLPNGTLQAVSGASVVASAPGGAVMWDSTDRLATAAQSGDLSRIANVAMKLEGTDLILTPDTALLDSAATRFPVYIDPWWDSTSAYGAPRWAYANNYNANNDLTSARVGRSPGQPGYVYRSFFDFPTYGIRGKHIATAYVHMLLDHSHSCDPHYTEMYHSWTQTTSPRTAWSQPLNQWMSRAASNANEGAAADCPAGQPDQDVNFMDKSATERTVTDIVQAYANNPWDILRVAFVGSDEGSLNSWKRFFQTAATLVVYYSSYPGQPNGLTVAGVACPASGRLTIGTLNPQLSALYPDADSDQTLTGDFEWLEIPASGTYDDSTPRKPAPPPMPMPANGRGVVSLPSPLQVGKAYAFRVSTKDPYNLGSGWSPWCEFAPDTSRPKAPVVTPVGTPGGPGTKLTVRLTTDDLSVTKFRYGAKYPPTAEVAATTSGTTKTATVEVTIPSYGLNNVYAQGVNSVQTIGNDGSTGFTATRPSPPIAQWGLETYPGQTATQALEDKQPGLGGNTPLTATGLGWAQNARMVGGQVAGVGGTTQLTTSAPVVDTTRSYSVAGWYRRTATSAERAVLISQDAAGGGSGFALFYFPPYATWGFLINDQTGGGQLTQPYAPGPADDWVHVAGVFDAPEKKVRLYLNGVLADEKPLLTPVSSTTGKTRVGAAATKDATTWTAAGQAADVRVYDRVLVADDFTGKLKSDPSSGGFDEPGMLTATKVGDWDFEAGVPCYDPSIPDTCEAPDATAFNRRMRLTTGAEIAPGHRGSALWLDGQESASSQVQSGQTWSNGPVLLTEQSYTLSAWVYLPSGVTGHRVAVSQQDPVVASSAMFLSYDSSDDKWHFWLGEYPGVDFSPRTVASSAVATRDRWVHLTGVFDAGRGKLRLYVNGVLQGVQDKHTPWRAGGPLVLGSVNWRGLIVQHWQGGLDDVTAHRGAMSDAAVKSLYDQQLG